MFDCDGVQATSILKIKDRYVMYYAGYCNLKDGYYHLFSGIAESSDGVKFQRKYERPFLDRISGELTVRVAPVVFNQVNNYGLLYISDNGWKELESKKKTPIYNMMYDDSHWYDNFSHPMIVLSPEIENNEIGFSRPWIDRSDVYFAVRKIESGNNPYVHIEKGIFDENSTQIVTRTKEIVLERSKNSFDSGMVAFPAVYNAPDGTKHMLYSGNGYGREGLLWAVEK